MNDINENQNTNAIDDVEEFYVLGLPIKTKIGNCHFLKVKNYPKLYADLQIVSLTKLHFVHGISKENEGREDLLNEFKQLSLMQIVRSYSDVRKVYIRVFAHFFKDENAFFNIRSESEFDYYRSLILKLSCIKEEKINPNPEIQEAIERSRRVKAQDGEKMAFADIVTSVSAIKGVGYDEINEMTLFQLYMDFYRIAQDKNYHTSALFATVAEKVEIEGWNKHIDMFEEEHHGLTRKEFSKVAGVLGD